jgi:hypothetical protein
MTFFVTLFVTLIRRRKTLFAVCVWVGGIRSGGNWGWGFRI